MLLKAAYHVMASLTIGDFIVILNQKAYLKSLIIFIQGGYCLVK